MSENQNAEVLDLETPAEVVDLADHRPEAAEVPGTPKAPACPLYCVAEEQTFNFRTTDDLGTYEFRHTFAPIAGKDDLLVQFDNDRLIEYSTQGKTTDVTPSSAGAALKLWLALIVSVDGYGEEGEATPENWKALTPDEDKIRAVNDLLFVEVVEDESDGPVVMRRRSWSADTTKTIRLRSYFSGAELETDHVLKPKTAAEVMAYDRIRSGIRLTKNAMQLKPQMKKKGELYDRMLSAVRGYAGDAVPLHHKAAVITALFDSDAESTAKK